MDISHDPAPVEKAKRGRKRRTEQENQERRQHTHRVYVEESNKLAPGVRAVYDQLIKARVTKRMKMTEAEYKKHIAPRTDTGLPNDLTELLDTFVDPICKIEGLRKKRERQLESQTTTVDDKLKKYLSEQKKYQAMHDNDNDEWNDDEEYREGDNIQSTSTVLHQNQRKKLTARRRTSQRLYVSDKTIKPWMEDVDDNIPLETQDVGMKIRRNKTVFYPPGTQVALNSYIGLNKFKGKLDEIEERIRLHKTKHTVYTTGERDADRLEIGGLVPALAESILLYCKDVAGKLCKNKEMFAIQRAGLTQLFKRIKIVFDQKMEWHIQAADNCTLRIPIESEITLEDIVWICVNIIGVESDGIARLIWYHLEGRWKYLDSCRKVPWKEMFGEPFGNYFSSSYKYIDGGDFIEGDDPNGPLSDVEIMKQVNKWRIRNNCVKACLAVSDKNTDDTEDAEELLMDGEEVDINEALQEAKEGQIDEEEDIRDKLTPKAQKKQKMLQKIKEVRDAALMYGISVEEWNDLWKQNGGSIVLQNTIQRDLLAMLNRNAYHNGPERRLVKPKQVTQRRNFFDVHEMPGWNGSVRKRNEAASSSITDSTLPEVDASVATTSVNDEQDDVNNPLTEFLVFEGRLMNSFLVSYHNFLNSMSPSSNIKNYLNLREILLSVVKGNPGDIRHYFCPLFKQFLDLLAYFGTEPFRCKIKWYNLYMGGTSKQAGQKEPWCHFLGKCHDRCCGALFVVYILAEPQEGVDVRFIVSSIASSRNEPPRAITPKLDYNGRRREGDFDTLFNSYIANVAKKRARGYVLPSTVNTNERLRMQNSGLLDPYATMDKRLIYKIGCNNIFLPCLIEKEICEDGSVRYIPQEINKKAPYKCDVELDIASRHFDKDAAVEMQFPQIKTTIKKNQKKLKRLIGEQKEIEDVEAIEFSRLNAIEAKGSEIGKKTGENIHQTSSKTDERRVAVQGGTIRSSMLLKTGKARDRYKPFMEHILPTKAKPKSQLVKEPTFADVSPETEVPKEDTNRTTNLDVNEMLDDISDENLFNSEQYRRAEADGTNLQMDEEEYENGDSIKQALKDTPEKRLVEIDATTVERTLNKTGSDLKEKKEQCSQTTEPTQSNLVIDESQPNVFSKLTAMLSTPGARNEQMNLSSTVGPSIARDLQASDTIVEQEQHAQIMQRPSRTSKIQAIENLTKSSSARSALQIPSFSRSNSSEEKFTMEHVLVVDNDLKTRTMACLQKSQSSEKNSNIIGFFKEAQCINWKIEIDEENSSTNFARATQKLSQQRRSLLVAKVHSDIEKQLLTQWHGKDLLSLKSLIESQCSEELINLKPSIQHSYSWLMSKGSLRLGNKKSFEFVRNPKIDEIYDSHFKEHSQSIHSAESPSVDVGISLETGKLDERFFPNSISCSHLDSIINGDIGSGIQTQRCQIRENKTHFSKSDDPASSEQPYYRTKKPNDIVPFSYKVAVNLSDNGLNLFKLFADQLNQFPEGCYAICNGVVYQNDTTFPLYQQAKTSGGKFIITMPAEGKRSGHLIKILNRFGDLLNVKQTILDPIREMPEMFIDYFKSWTLERKYNFSGFRSMVLCNTLKYGFSGNTTEKYCEIWLEKEIGIDGVTYEAMVITTAETVKASSGSIFVNVLRFRPNGPGLSTELKQHICAAFKSYTNVETIIIHTPLVSPLSQKDKHCSALFALAYSASIIYNNNFSEFQVVPDAKGSYENLRTRAVSAYNAHDLRLLITSNLCTKLKKPFESSILIYMEDDYSKLQYGNQEIFLKPVCIPNCRLEAILNNKRTNVYSCCLCSICTNGIQWNNVKFTPKPTEAKLVYPTVGKYYCPSCIMTFGSPMDQDDLSSDTNMYLAFNDIIFKRSDDTNVKLEDLYDFLCMICDNKDFRTNAVFDKFTNVMCPNTSNDEINLHGIMSLCCSDFDGIFDDHGILNADRNKLQTIQLSCVMQEILLIKDDIGMFIVVKGQLFFAVASKVTGKVIVFNPLMGKNKLCYQSQRTLTACLSYSIIGLLSFGQKVIGKNGPCYGTVWKAFYPDHNPYCELAISSMGIIAGMISHFRTATSLHYLSERTAGFWILTLLRIALSGERFPELVDDECNTMTNLDGIDQYKAKENPISTKWVNINDAKLVKIQDF